MAMRGFSARLAARVVLIVAIVIVPAMSVMVYDQVHERRRAREDAVENVTRLANLAASEESRILTGVEHLLTTLVMFPGLRDGDQSACRALLPNVLRNHRAYINIFAVYADGSQLCSGAGVPAARAAERPAPQSAWFIRAMQNRATAIGDYQISLTNGRPSVVMAQQIVDATGRITGVVAAVIGLEELNATFKAVKLPRGATLTLTDQHGTILARTPDADAWLGRRHTQFSTQLVPGSDLANPLHESTGSDGVRRLYVVLPVEAGVSSGLYVTLDIESGAIFAHADEALMNHLWLLALVTFAALAVALVGGHMLVLQPVEARHREAEERMRFALAVSKVGVWRTQVVPGAEQVYWSETLEAMHGLEPGTFGGQFDDFNKCIHPDDREPVVAQIVQAQAENRNVTVEYRTIWPDGTERRLATTGYYTFGANGEFVSGTGVTIDITDQRSLEDQLRQSQKMEAVGRLAGGIAHDFNNMLMAVLGNAEFLLDSLLPGDARRNDVVEIKRAAERGAALTHQLLAFSRKQILAPRVLHMGDIVNGMAPMLRRLLGETIDLRTTMGDRSHVKADAGQIEQVLMNLAVNARDAMTNGGRLTIETGDVTLDANYVRMHEGLLPGSYVVMAVSDTGHGMDAVTAKRVFEPFFTTKPVGQGTGLGLATVYGIVKQSGGHIGVYSEAGRGTSFKVYLPKTEERLLERKAAQTAQAPRGDETVLVVDDEAVVRELVSKILTRQGYRVHAMDTAEAALAFASDHHADIDLILTDVVLPEMSGPTIIRMLNERHICPPVIYMSGYTDEAVVFQGPLDADAVFLQKPFTSERLAATVRQVLDTPAVV
jgi:PAS domain S-box-containing protein